MSESPHPPVADPHFFAVMNSGPPLLPGDEGETNGDAAAPNEAAEE